MDEEAYKVPDEVSVPWRDLRMDESRRPPERDVVITDIRTMTISGNYPWGIVKVETDTDHYGIGEAFHGHEAVDVVDRISRHVIGENPLDIDRLMELLEQRYTGAGYIGKAAMTGIEIALWDLKGKLFDVPVYELLGGKYRSSVQTYCDTHAGESVGAALDGDADTVYTPESYAKAAREVVNDGFKSLKFDLDVPMPGEDDEDVASRRLDNRAINHKVSLVEAVRDEIGYDVDLGVDLHWNFTVETAIRLGKKLERFDLAFIEDPVPPGKLGAQQRVTEALNTPVLTGENIVDVGRFDELVSAGALDIAAPDVNKCGGLLDLHRIATVCDLHGVPLAPHNLSSPVGVVAGAHLGAAIPNFMSIEFRGRDVPWWNDLVTRTGERGPILSNGSVAVPEGPGLGIDIDAQLADEHKTADSGLIF